MITKLQIKRNLKFIAALRSGKYKQGTGQLRVEDTFCCLGVACDIHRKTTRKGEWVQGPRDFNYNAAAYPENKVPPIEVVRWYGWPDDNPIIRVAGNLSQAAIHNDEDRRTFKQIAIGFERWLKVTIKEQEKAKKTK